MFCVCVPRGVLDRFCRCWRKNPTATGVPQCRILSTLHLLTRFFAWLMWGHSPAVWVRRGLVSPYRWFFASFAWIVLSFPAISLFCFVALPRCRQAQRKCSARLTQQTSGVLLTCYRSFPAELKNTTVPMEPGFILHHHLPLPRDTKGYQGIPRVYMVYDMLNELNASSAQTPKIQQNLQPPQVAPWYSLSFQSQQAPQGHSPCWDATLVWPWRRYDPLRGSPPGMLLGCHWAGPLETSWGVHAGYPLFHRIPLPWFKMFNIKLFQHISFTIYPKTAGNTKICNSATRIEALAKRGPLPKYS